MINRIIQILKNEEYVDVKRIEIKEKLIGSLNYFTYYYEITTNNGGKIRIEQSIDFKIYFYDKYYIQLFIPNEKESIKEIIIEHNNYFFDEFENLYYKIKNKAKIHEELNKEENELKKYNKLKKYF